MDLFSQFATDDNLEVNGAWHPSPDKKGRFLIARAGNRKYNRELAKRLEENSAEIDNTSDVDKADAKSELVMAELYADTILLGWDGDLMFKPNEPLGPYSRARAIEVLLMKEFRKWVAQRSNEMDKYRAKLEVAQGNA